MITMGSGNYVQDVKFGIITYCQRIDMSKIVKILTTGNFEENVEITIDNDKLGTTADPHGIYKDAITNEIRQKKSILFCTISVGINRRDGSNTLLFTDQQYDKHPRFSFDD